MVALLPKIEGTSLNELFNIFRATKFRALQGTAKQLPVVALCLSVSLSLFLQLWKLLVPEQNSKCDTRVEVSDGMLWKYLCIKDLCLHVKDNYRKNLQAGNCAKERQLNHAKLREIKDNSYKFSKN